jgi:hypothetical protein
MLANIFKGGVGSFVNIFLEHGSFDKNTLCI